MRYAVVVVTFNRLEMLKECVEKIKEQQLSFTDIVIVDNNSQDGTYEYLEELQDENIFCHHLKKNYGGSGGFCYGMKKAMERQPDWILLIDDDAMLEPDYLAALASYIERHPDVTAVSGTVVCNDAIDFSHRRRLSHPYLFLEGNVPAPEYEKEAFCYELSTFCGLMVKTEVVRKIGLPKKDFFLWYDDTEYSFRLKKYGGIWNVNDAKLVHKTKNRLDGNFIDRINWKSYYGFRNRFVTASLHMGTVTRTMVYLEFYAFMILSVVYEGAKGRFKEGLKKAEIMWDAMVDGVGGCLGIRKEYRP